MVIEKGDRFDSTKELPNGELIDVKIKVDEVEHLEDGSEIIHTSLTDESQNDIEQELKEMEHPASEA